MSTEEMNVLRILEREIIGKICELVKEGESWRITTFKEIKDTLQGTDFIRLIKSLRPRWYGRTEKMQNQRM